jgi:hypothetical protein
LDFAFAAGRCRRFEPGENGICSRKAMLYEIDGVKGYPNEPKRRWFFDHDLDLTVWFDEDEKIVGFQICYDKPADPHAFTWWAESGYQHHKIDDGERLGTLARKGIPVLMLDGVFEKERIAELFRQKSTDIDSRISFFVYNKIVQFSRSRP